MGSKLAGFLFAAFFFSTANASPDIVAARAAQVDGHLFVCTDSNFEGDCVNLGFTSGACINFQAPFQDSISSWGPDNGFVCSLFFDIDCAGESMSGSNPGFTKVPDLFGDELSSFRCFSFAQLLSLNVPTRVSTATPTSTISSTSPMDGRLFVCTDPNFAGVCANLDFHSGDCNNFQPPFQNSISSWNLDNGFFCVLFNDRDCTGIAVAGDTGFSTLSAEFDNQTNSFQCNGSAIATVAPFPTITVFPTVPSPQVTGHLFVCTDRNFAGSCSNLAFTTGDCINFEEPFQNSISSWGPDVGFVCTLFVDGFCNSNGSLMSGSNPGFTDIPEQLNDQFNSFQCFKS